MPTKKKLSSPLLRRKKNPSSPLCEIEKQKSHAAAHRERPLGLGWWRSDHGVWGNFCLEKLKPPQSQPAAPFKVKTRPAAPLGGRRPEKFCGFGYGFARKKLELAPSTEKKKALGLALSVKKNSGLARAKKKSSPLLKSKTVVLALFARGKLEWRRPSLRPLHIRSGPQGH